jgi:hypothetical protein
MVTWSRPNGNVDLEILSIDYPSPATPPLTEGDFDP